MDDSVIKFDEITEETKAIPANFNEQEMVCKTQTFFILLAFFLVTTVFLIAVNIYFYLINHRAKKKNLDDLASQITI